MIIYCLFCTDFYCFKQKLGLAALNNNEFMIKHGSSLKLELNI